MKNVEWTTIIGIIFGIIIAGTMILPILLLCGKELWGLLLR